MNHQKENSTTLRTETTRVEVPVDLSSYMSPDDLSGFKDSIDLLEAMSTPTQQKVKFETPPVRDAVLSGELSHQKSDLGLEDTLSGHLQMVATSKLNGLAKQKLAQKEPGMSEHWESHSNRQYSNQDLLGELAMKGFISSEYADSVAELDDYATYQAIVAEMGDRALRLVEQSSWSLDDHTIQGWDYPDLDGKRGNSDYISSDSITLTRTKSSNGALVSQMDVAAKGLDTELFPVRKSLSVTVEGSRLNHPRVSAVYTGSDAEQVQHYAELHNPEDTIYEVQNALSSVNRRIDQKIQDSL